MNSTTDFIQRSSRRFVVLILCAVLTNSILVNCTNQSASSHPAELRTLEGIVTFDGGLMVDSVNVYLSPTDSRKSSTTLTTTAAPLPGGLGLAFSFIDADFTNARVSVEERSDILWDKQSVEIGPRTRQVHFNGRVRPEFAKVLRFNIIDRLTKRGLRNSSAEVWQRSPLRANQLTRNLDESFDMISGKFGWAVRVNGYGIAFGDEKSAVVDGASKRIDVELEPGWGALFRAESKDRLPIMDAVIAIDDEIVATTNQYGVAFVNRTVTPKKISVTHPNWLPAWSGSHYDIRTGEVIFPGGLEVVTQFMPR